MVRKILIVTATEVEASGLRTLTRSLPGTTAFGGTTVDFLVTGIGTIACARALMNYLHNNGRPDLAVNAGIAGSFDRAFKTGDSALVWRDGFADFGIDDRGRFITAAEAGLVDRADSPFGKEGWIECSNNHLQELKGSIPFCTGITSDTVSGSTERISFLKNRFNPDIETMEGASFFYICALEQVPFIAIRTVSNKVEERDRSSWNIPLALNNLKETIRGILTTLTLK
jgi:futalosine hydrolase